MFTEILESRRFLSVSAVSSAITVERAVIKLDLAEFKADASVGAAKIQVDVAKLKALDLKSDTTLAPLFSTLKVDAKAESTALAADNLAESKAVTADQTAIVAELKLEVKDKKNPTALAADKAAVVTDRIQLQSDEVAGLDSRVTTRTTLDTKVFADLTAISTAANAETGVSEKFTAAVNKFVTDSTALTTKLPTDLSKISTARTQLIADYTTLETTAS
jgi:hypothetical protein